MDCIYTVVGKLALLKEDNIQFNIKYKPKERIQHSYSMYPPWAANLTTWNISTK